MEENLTYSKIFIALICLFVSRSFAFEVITSSEENALYEIQTKYDVDNQLISANDKLSNYNKRQYEYKSLANTIFADKKKYERFIKALPETVISGEGVAEYFKDIENLLLAIDKAESEYVATGIALKEEYQMIEMDYAKLNDLRAERNEKLYSLKKQVVDRLVSDLSKPNSQHRFNRQGSAVCSRFQSIKDCLDENKAIIVSKIKKSEPFLNDRSVLLSYEVNNASMNMDGGLNYDVSMAFKSSYNTRVESLLNEKFGLKSAIISLESNVDVDWFVDGNKVGTGKNIQHEVTLGRHGILASYKSKDQSSIEVIESNGAFTYIFDNTVAPLLPQKTVKVKEKAKTKTVVKKENSEVVKKVANKPATKKVVKLTPKSSNAQPAEEQGYLFFMGIEPESKKQDNQFQN